MHGLLVSLLISVIRFAVDYVEIFVEIRDIQRSLVPLKKKKKKTEVSIVIRIGISIYMKRI